MLTVAPRINIIEQFLRRSRCKSPMMCCGETVSILLLLLIHLSLKNDAHFHITFISAFMCFNDRTNVFHSCFDWRCQWYIACHSFCKNVFNYIRVCVLLSVFVSCLQWMQPLYLDCLSFSRDKYAALHENLYIYWTKSGTLTFITLHL